MLGCGPYGWWLIMLACKMHGISLVVHGHCCQCTFRDSFWYVICTWLGWGLLITLWKMDMLSCFWMVGDNGMVTVQCKSDHLSIFIAQLIHRCYQVPPLAYYCKISTAATDFRQQALEHFSTRLCRSASDVYADDCISLRAKNAFLSPRCDNNKYKYWVPVPLLYPQCKNLFNLIWVDFLVPLSVESARYRKYMLSFVEDKTPYAKVTVYHEKPDAPRLMKAFGKKVDTQMQRYSGSFWTDQGAKFSKQDLQAYSKQKGITHKLGATDSQESNSIAARYNLIRYAMVQPALKHTPAILCAEACKWGCYITYRLPHSAVDGITPYEALHNAKPCISHIRR